MSEKNTSQNIITVVSVVIALMAVAYALMCRIERPGQTERLVQENISIAEVTSKTPEASDNNPVVMTVNGDKITRVEVLDNFVASGSQLPQGANLGQLFPLLQEQYLMGKIIENAAEDAGIDVNTPEVQEKLQQAKERAIRAVYMDKIGSEMVTDEDIQQAYEDIVANQPETVERKARHILVEEEAKANALIVKLNQGSDFATLAEENSEGPTASQGGDLGYFSSDQMVPEFSEAAFALDVGEFTQQPVQTQFGYHVILVEDERTREKPAFADVEDQLAQQLRQAAIGEKMQKLRQAATVTMFDMNGGEMPSPEATASEQAPAAGEEEVGNMAEEMPSENIDTMANEDDTTAEEMPSEDTPSEEETVE